MLQKSFSFRCEVGRELCNLFCQEDGVLDLCDAKNVGEILNFFTITAGFKMKKISIYKTLKT